MGRGETDDRGRERLPGICVRSEHCSFLIEQHLVQVDSDVGDQDTGLAASTSGQTINVRLLLRIQREYGRNKPPCIADAGIDNRFCTPSVGPGSAAAMIF